MEELKAGRRSGEGSPSPASMAEHGIFVSDIARGVTDQQLKEAFASVGQVVDALVVKNKLTGETKGTPPPQKVFVPPPLTQAHPTPRQAGYGFVKFATPEAVEAALALPELPTFRDAVSNKVSVPFPVFAAAASMRSPPPPLRQMVRAVRADPKNVLYVGNLPCGLAAEDDVLQTLQEVLTVSGPSPPPPLPHRAVRSPRRWSSSSFAKRQRAGPRATAGQHSETTKARCRPCACCR